ncbi:hypothetical protein C0Z18_10935 [Trinickia dabaoshanensis]|uniref:HPt domain-containing protein n=1 Tax=Trinickia dabaoshanensis TaxID=564714 RepID=A0A2N7VTG0_9BURK|nr:hypothetical protein [Trinickia dabaoshanensis]PMS20446.1 hypothetical protein C0Z18_10935 [Trinickia dabaoshanensis]
MSTYDRRSSDMRDTHEGCSFDLSELSMLYGAAGLRTLLAVALDEFDCQHLAMDGALGSARWPRAAQALHRLTGTAAFFVSDERMLDPLSHAERALRLGDASLIDLTIPAARAALAAIRLALTGELSKSREAL